MSRGITRRIDAAGIPVFLTGWWERYELMEVAGQPTVVGLLSHQGHNYDFCCDAPARDSHGRQVSNCRKLSPERHV